MMATWFRVWAPFNEIRAIEVERETSDYVYPKGSKRGDKKHPVDRSYQQWFETLDEAKAFLVAYAEDRLESARERVELAAKHLEAAKQATVREGDER